MQKAVSQHLFWDEKATAKRCGGARADGAVSEVCTKGYTPASELVVVTDDRLTPCLSGPVTAREWHEDVVLATLGWGFLFVRRIHRYQSAGARIY